MRRKEGFSAWSSLEEVRDDLSTDEQVCTVHVHTGGTTLREVESTYRAA
jgi:hypothetical protein